MIKQLTNSISVMACCLVGTALLSCSHDQDLGNEMPETVMVSEMQTNVGSMLVLAPGLSKQVEYTLNPANVTSPVLKWRIIDESVATVTQDGYVSAVGVGKTSIIVTQEPGLTELATITVNVKPVATAISLQPAALYQRTSKQLVVDVTPVGGYDVFQWSSSDESLAKVDQNGIVTASDTKYGTVTITARSLDGSNLTTSATIEVKEIVPVTGIELKSPGYDLGIGDKGQITTTLIPGDATADLLEWASSDEEIVTVTPSGEVTGIGYGTATITAKAESGVTQTIDITVGEGTINQDFSRGMGAWNFEQASSAAVQEGYTTITMSKSGSNWRGDFGPSVSNNRRDVVLNVGTYRYFAIKMTRPGKYQKNANKPGGTIVLDTARGRYQQKDGNGNNRYSILGYEDREADCPMDEPCVVYFDLQSGFGNDPHLYPTAGLETVNLFKILVADIPVDTYAGTFNVWWAHTFKTMDEMKSFAENN